MTSKTTLPRPQAPDVVDSEKTLAGSILLEPGRVLKLARGAGVTADTFSDGVARRVFAAAVRLIDAGRLAEPVEVQRESALDAATVQALIDNTPTAAHAEYHIEIVRAAAVKRDALRQIKDAAGVEALRLALRRIEAGLPSVEGAGAGAENASDWLAEPDEAEEPIIAGLIDAGDRVAVVGQSKARKSFYALQLAVAVATGEPFLGYETERRRVLLFNGEIRAAAYKRRLRRMVARLGIAPDALADLLVVNASEDATPATFETILTTARRSKASVVVTDPAYLLIDGDETDQTAVKDAVKAMKQFTSEGMTLVMIFHATKGRMGDRQTIDRISGSGIFARDCSTMISLCEHATEADHAVMAAITRNHPPCDPATIMFDEGAFTIADGVAAVEKTSMTKPKRVISDAELLACFDATERKYGDAVDILRERLAIGRDRAKTELARAVKDGLVRAIPRGNATFYTLWTDSD